MDPDTADPVSVWRFGPGDEVRLGAQGAYRPAEDVLGARLPGPLPPAVYAPPPAPASQGSAEVWQWPAKAAAVGCALVFAGEVIVVIASIPIFLHSRTAHRRASCLSNVKQIDLALMMYAQDYDEMYPPPGNWEPLLDPYIRNASLWTCPARPKEPGYGHNDKLGSRYLFEAPNPPETLTFWDAGAPVPGFPPPPGTTSPRHGSVDNFGYADGHAKSVAPAQLHARTDP